MKNILTLLVASAIAYGASAQNTLTSKEKREGWKALFDGKTTKGWHTYLKPEATAAWKVEDSALTLDPKAEGQGDLVTNEEYENFDLSLEWKISETGNSGVIFGVHEDPSFGQSYLTGIEMQVLDNKGAEDNKKQSHLAGSLYDMRPPAKDVAKPAGEWNVARVRKKDGQLTFWLNGTETINVKIGSPEWQELLNNSKFKNWKGFAAYPKGKIALQDHGHEVWYRNIKIRTAV